MIYKIQEISLLKIFTLEYLKNYLRVSYDHDDELINNLLAAAINSAEIFTGLSINKRSVSCEVKKAQEIVFLKYFPILKIENIYLQEPPSKKQKLEIDYASLIFEDGKLNLAGYKGQNLQIEYQAGYEAEKLPKSINAGILLHISDMYDNKDQDFTESEQIRQLYLPYRQLKI